MQDTNLGPLGENKFEGLCLQINGLTVHDDTILNKELVYLGLNELVEELQNEELAFIHIKK